MVYRAAMVTQKDGSSLQWSNCRMAVAATHLDFHTDGKKKSTGAKMRSFQDDQQGGTDADDARIAWQRGYAEQLVIRNGYYWDKLLTDRERDWFIELDVWYALLPERCQDAAQFGHTIAIAPETNAGGSWLVGDPLCAQGVWNWMDPADLKRAAQEWGARVLGGASGRTHGPIGMERFGVTGGDVPIRYTTAVETRMVDYIAPLNEVGGTITTRIDTQTIPLEGAVGERLPVNKGATRPAIGVFKLPALDNVEAYLMLVGTRLAFVKAGAVTFTPNASVDTNTIIETRDAQWLERLTPPR